MRLRLLILLATLSVALALSCDQRPADPALPTVDVQWNTVVNFHRERDVVSVWGSGSDNVYVAYGQPRNNEEVGLPRISRYDGISWTPADVPIADENGDPVIWGSGEDDIYVAVEQLHHFDGVSWSTAPVNAQWVTGTSRDDVVAADHFGIFTFDGAEWDTLRTMDGVAIRGLSSATDGSVFYSALGAISIWNGSTWTDTTLPGNDYAESVIAFSNHEAFVNGYSYRTYRWDGVSWTAEPGLQEYSAFAGTSANDAYACGFNGRVVHLEGLTWEPLPIGTGFNLHAAYLAGSNLIVAGDQSKVLAWNGSVWSPLYDASPVYPGTVFAESSSRMLVNDGSSVFLFDHGKWSEKPLPAQAGAFGGSSISDVYTGTSSGIFHFDGTNWSLSDSLVENQTDFWRSPSDLLYSIGRGSAYRLNGTWEQIYDGEFEFRVVGGDGGEGIVATGRRTQFDRDMLVAHFDGTTWRELPAPESDTFGIWSGPDMDLYLAGTGGLWHWNGVKFKRLSPPQHGFFGVFPLPDKRVVATGVEEVAVYDGFLLNLIPEERHFGYPTQALDGTILLRESDEDRISAWRP